MKRFAFLECIYFVLTYVYVSSLLLSSENIYGKGLINGVLSETRTHSCFHFEWFSVNYRFIYRSFWLFLECVYLCLLYPSLIFDKFLSLCVCVCVCVEVVLDFTNSYFSSVSVWMYVMEIFCVCMCGSLVWNLLVSIFSNNFCLCIYTHIYVCLYIYIYIYIYICFHLDAFVRDYVWHKVQLMGYSMRLELVILVLIAFTYLWFF